MANFSASALVAGQAKFLDYINKGGEWRLPDSAALKVANMAEIANPSLKTLRTREDRAVYAYFPIRQAATNGSARAYNHTGASSDSAAATITWTQLVEPFSVSIKQADNNVFDFSEMYAAGMRNAIYNLISRADALFVAWLGTNKTQVNAGGGLGAFDSTADVYEVPKTELNYFYQNAKAMMEFNNYRGQLIGVADTVAYSMYMRNSAQGSANATNLQFQFEGMNVVGTSREVLGTSSYYGSGYFWENGLVAAIPWIPKQNNKPLDPEKAISFNGDWGSIFVPELGVNFALHSYATRADNAGGGGYSQDLVIYVEVSVDLGFQAAPLSTSTASVIHAVGQLTA